MRPVPSHPSVLARIVEIALFVSLGAGQAFATTQTTTTLSVGPSNNVTAGAVVILTATVTNPSAVTKGTVKFCNALITDCGPGRGLYGTAALSSAGTAVLRTRLGVGVANIQASFLATTANAGSTSLTNSVAVSASPIYASSTTLSASGGVGNYNLGGVVTGFGSQPLTGSLTFLDSTNGNDQIGLGSLNTATSSFANQVSYASGAAYTVAVGDFNGDGIPDLAVANNNGSASAGSVSVLLGNGEALLRPLLLTRRGQRLCRSQSAILTAMGSWIWWL